MAEVGCTGPREAVVDSIGIGEGVPLLEEGTAEGVEAGEEELGECQQLQQLLVGLDWQCGAGPVLVVGCNTSRLVPVPYIPVFQCWWLDWW